MKIAFFHVQTLLTRIGKNVIRYDTVVMEVASTNTNDHYKTAPSSPTISKSKKKGGDVGWQRLFLRLFLKRSNTYSTIYLVRGLRKCSKQLSESDGESARSLARRNSRHPPWNVIRFVRANPKRHIPSLGHVLSLANPCLAPESSFSSTTNSTSKGRRAYG